MLKELKSFKDMIRQIIRDELRAIKPLDYYVVTGVNTDKTINIKRLNDSLSFNSIEMLGIGLGNMKGQFMLPSVDDVVLVGFVNNSEKPVILGSLFDMFSTEKDNKPQINDGEYIVINKTNGSFIFLDSDSNIKLKNSNGSIVLNADGTLTINGEYTLPSVDGANGQVMKTDGSGVLTWQNDNI